MKFLDAGEKESYIYYTSEQLSLGGDMPTNDSRVKRVGITIDFIDDTADIYIRIKDPETLEYVVACESEIESGKYLEDIKLIKLKY